LIKLFPTPLPLGRERSAGVAAYAAAFALFLALAMVPVSVRADTADFKVALRSVVSVLPDWPAANARLEEPEGSGVVVLDGRSVITAMHVVEKARNIRIRTSSGQILKAWLQGTDRATDLALLKLDTRLAPLAFGGDVELGQGVCAIGNAFGLGLSVTCGTVSAVNRAGVGFNSIEDFVQTDAAVNPGSSGGALIDGEGRLVGVLSAIFTKTSDANIGVNFAISAPLARKVVQALSVDGSIAWQLGGLGLKAYPAKDAVGQMAAEVVRVRTGGPAEVAGLKPGDRLIFADGRRIRKPADFRSIMARQNGGTVVTVEIRRGEQTIKLPIQVPKDD